MCQAVEDGGIIGGSPAQLSPTTAITVLALPGIPSIVSSALAEAWARLSRTFSDCGGCQNFPEEMVIFNTTTEVDLNGVTWDKNGISAA